MRSLGRGRKMEEQSVDRAVQHTHIYQLILTAYGEWLMMPSNNDNRVIQDHHSQSTLADTKL